MRMTASKLVHICATTEIGTIRLHCPLRVCDRGPLPKRFRHDQSARAITRMPFRHLCFCPKTDRQVGSVAVRSHRDGVEIPDSAALKKDAVSRYVAAAASRIVAIYRLNHANYPAYSLTIFDPNALPYPVVGAGAGAGWLVCCGQFGTLM
jgi:hypothetical protein